MKNEYIIKVYENLKKNWLKTIYNINFAKQ